MKIKKLTTIFTLLYFLLSTLLFSNFYSLFSLPSPVSAALPTTTLTDTFANSTYIQATSSAQLVGGQTKAGVAADVGTGADGAVTISSNKNINTDTIATGRTCADGVNYSVTALTANTATLSTTPAAGCLTAGDEVLLINLQGTSANYANVGNYEFLRISSINTATVTFSGNKTKYYGNGASDDTNLGTATTNQRVMLQRIPNYTNVTVSTGTPFSATGGTITTSGGYTIHTFTTGATFTPNGASNVEVLVVAGGGSGGGSAASLGGGGGGGAGGLIYNSSFAVTAQAYPVTVGASVAGVINAQGISGNNSIFSTLTAVGGGGGGAGGSSGSTIGLNGGSGGGAGYKGYTLSTVGNGTSGQGYAGGQNGATSWAGGGGGGGSGSVGQVGQINHAGGAGGSGTANSISGASVTYAAGGGGSSQVNGTANTGNGGGGTYAGGGTTGSGGSGIVIIRYLTAVGNSLTASAWDGTKGGVLAFRANGTVTNAGTISMSGKGYRGGNVGGTKEAYSTSYTPYAGESYHRGVYQPVYNTNHAGGGSGGMMANLEGMTGGFGGAYGTNGVNGTSAYNGGSYNPAAFGGAGVAYGSANLTKMYFGSGGGEGSNYYYSGAIAQPAGYGSGGIGGGIIFIASTTLSNNDTISANGGVGQNGYLRSNTASDISGGGGGGGAGGSIYLNSSSLTLGTLTSTGGAGGSATATSYGSWSAAPNGGSGGSGRITIGYVNTPTGTTNPTYTGATLTALATSSFLMSKNLLASINSTTTAVTAINSITYNLSSLPNGTSATIQFSQNGRQWYNSARVLGGTDTLSTGTNNTISLTALHYYGYQFYYKITYTTTGSTSPVLDDISLNYTTTTVTANNSDTFVDDSKIDTANSTYYQSYGTSSLGTLYSPGKSCSSLKLTGITTDGTYWIDPDGTGPNLAFQAYCNMTTDGGGWTLIMKLSAGSFCYGSSNWTSQTPVNESYTLNSTMPSAGEYDAKSKAFYLLNDINVLKFQTNLNTVNTTFVSGSTPQNLMTTNNVNFSTYPDRTAWKNAFGHDRDQAPIFQRGGVNTTTGNTCRTNSSVNNSGCGQLMMFGYQAADGNCCGCSVTANDVNSGIGQNSAYCGGGQTNCSTAGQWSNTTLRTIVWAKNTAAVADIPPTAGLQPTQIGNSSINPGISCSSLRAAGKTTDGYYWIDPDGSGGNTSFFSYCDMTTDGGGWTKVAKFGTAYNISGATYSTGFGVSSDAQFALPCANFNSFGTNIKMRINMGSVKDYFKPTSSYTLCQMITESPGTHFQWSSTADGTYLTPTYYTTHLGGSATSWPTDGRTYLSFWGGSGTATSSCCHNTSNNYSPPVDGAAWSKSFEMFVKHTSATADTPPQSNIISKNLLLNETKTVNRINAFIYSLALPSGTSASILFSQNGTSWVNALGQVSPATTLTSGTNNVIVIRGLGWTGNNFYYKIVLGSTTSAIPNLTNVQVKYDTQSQVLSDLFATSGYINATGSANYAVSNNQLRLATDIAGNGADGAITIATSKNINTDTIATGRTVADGINYAVSAIGTNSVTTSAAPNGITAGDEVILINLQGDATNYGNVGNYESLRVASVNGSTVTFTSNISKIYGATSSNSTLTGQKIMLQRVPNYTNVTINSGQTLSASAWDGTKGGVLAFRANGTVTVNGNISANSLGFTNGNTYKGYGINGGGGGGGGNWYNGGSGGTGLGSGVSGTAGANSCNGGGYNGYYGGNGGSSTGDGTGGNGGNTGGCNVYNYGSAQVGQIGNNGSDNGNGGAGSNYGYSGTGGGAGNFGGSGGPGGGGGGPGCQYTGTGLGGNGGGAAVAGDGFNFESRNIQGFGGGGGGGGYGTTGTGGLGGAAGTNLGGNYYAASGGGGGGAGQAYGNSGLSKLYLGSPGANATNLPGGIIGIFGNILNVNNSTGSISSNGGNYSGKSGGSSGGSILIQGDTITLNTARVTATGGSGGSSPSNGGTGGVGRIAVGGSTITGTTNPAANAAASGGSAYKTSSTVISENLVTDTTSSVESIDSLDYTVTFPTGTSATMQFSQNKTNWYNAASVLNASTALTTGTNNINLSALGWSGNLFYYKLMLVSDGTNTPVFTNIKLNYKLHPPSCEPPLSGDFTVLNNCTVPGAVNGTDNGHLIVANGLSLTVNAGQTLVWGPGKEVQLQPNATIIISDTASLKQTRLWSRDGDDDLYPDSSNLIADDGTPGTGFRLKSTMLSTGIDPQNVDCDDENPLLGPACAAVTPFPTPTPCPLYYADTDNDSYGNAASTKQGCDGTPSGYVANATDCDDTTNTKWQNLNNCYVDADIDTYGTGNVVTVCKGASCNSPTGHSTNNTDCDDTTNTKWQTLSCYLDADVDSYGIGDLVSVCKGASCTAPTGHSTNNTDCNDGDVTRWRNRYADGDSDTYGAGAAVCVGNHNGYSNTSTDCDDATATKWQLLSCCVNSDGDGYGTGTPASVCKGSSCNSPTGHAVSCTDCNDADINKWQNLAGYADADADTYTTGAEQQVCSGTSLPTGWRTSVNGADCNDADANVWVNATLYRDQDMDTYTVGTTQSVCKGNSTPDGWRVAANGSDCLDTDASKWRQRYVDADGDGYGTGALVCVGNNANYADNATDCDDTNGNIYQTVSSLITDADNDGYKINTSGSQCVGAGTTISSRTYYKAASGSYTWLLASQAIGSRDDCNDANASITAPGLCQKCSAGTVAPQASNEDVNNECSVSYDSCSGGNGSCIKSGPDGFCSGSGASCKTTGANANVANGYVCNNGAEISSTSTYNCGTATSCTAGSCVGTTYYRACGGAGTCRTDNTSAASANNIYAAAGQSLSAGCASGANGWAAGTTCEKCNGSGGTAPQASNEDLYTQCTLSYNSCQGGNGSCVKTGPDGFCSGSGASCKTINATLNVADGFVCNNGAEVLASGSVYCGTATSCTAGSCVGTTYYRACGGAGACRTDNTSAASANNIYATAGQSLSAGCASGANGWAAGTTCQKCNGSGGITPQGSEDIYSQCPTSWTGCSGTCTRTGSDGNCNGSGTCNTGSTISVTNGYVCTGAGSEISPTSSTYASLVNSCSAASCTGTIYYRACDGAGASRSDNTSAASQTVYATAGQSLSTSCTSGSNGNPGATCQRCNGSGSLAPQASNEDLYTQCTASTVCNGVCSKDVNTGNCNGSSAACGTGSTSYVADTYVCSGGADVAASASTYASIADSCSAGSCSGTRYYRSCNGAGATRSDNTGAASATIYATSSNTFDAACASNTNNTCATRTACQISRYCNGSGTCNAVTYVGAGADTYGDCATSWTTCPSICVRGGSDGNCNGSGTCNTGNTLNASTNYYCSSGSEVSGTCGTYGTCTDTRSSPSYSCSGTQYASGCTAGSCSNSNAFNQSCTLATAVTVYRDADGDGYGAGTGYSGCTGKGYVTNNTDCNDSCATCYPGATEGPGNCGNGLDEDCSGADLPCCTADGANNACTVNGDCCSGNCATYYIDADADGCGHTGTTVKRCGSTPPSGYVANSNDYSAGDGAACRSAQDMCDVAEVCSSGTCAANAFQPPSYFVGTCLKCTGSTVSPVIQTNAEDLFNLCTTGGDGSATSCKSGNCSGTTNSCGYITAGTTCRTSTGTCDLAETCSGAAFTCPADTNYAVNTVQCRAAGASATCDPAENCTGSSNTCPTNGYAAPFTLCGSWGSCQDSRSSPSYSCTGTQYANGCTPGGACATSISTQSCTLATATTVYRDADSDTYGAGTGYSGCTGQGYVTNNTDCNDSSSAYLSDGATCSVNGNCCSGACTTFYRDVDGDTYGTSGTTSKVCGSTPPSGYVTNSTDCDDSTNTKWQNLSAYTDTDGDGYGTGTVQSVCSGVFPPTGYCLCGPNICSGTNRPVNDCDPNNGNIWDLVDYYRDADGDTYTVGTITQFCVGYTGAPADYKFSPSNPLDCNDSCASCKPGGTEICGNGIDEDCNGYDPKVDGTACTVNGNCCNGTCTTFYRDADGDTYGTSGTTSKVCGTTPPSGYVTSSTDCYDSNADAKPGVTTRYTVHRGDGSFDYNCDGVTTKDPDKNCVTTLPAPGCAAGTSGHSGWVGSIPGCGVAVGTYRSCMRYSALYTCLTGYLGWYWQCGSDCYANRVLTGEDTAPLSCN